MALLFTQMPFCAARLSCAWIAELGIPLVRMPAGFSWMAELMADCCAVGVPPEIRSLYVQPRSPAACAQYCARTFALGVPESRPTSSFPAAGLLLSGVEMPIEVGALRNCCWYAFAAVTPLLADPPALLLLLLLLLLAPLPLVLLLLQPAMTSAEVTAMTAPSVFLIRASFLSGRHPGCRAVESRPSQLSTRGLLSWFST